MTKSRKLLICSPCHAAHGGVESIINDLCIELPKRGWDILLGLGKGSHFNNVEAYKTAYPDLPIIALDGIKGTMQGRLEALTRMIRKIRPDIVLSARIFDSYEAVARLKKQFSGMPRFAVTIRGYESPYLYDAAAYKNIIDLCIVDGNLLTNAAIKLADLPPRKVVSIPGGIMPPRGDVKLRNHKDSLRIGYVGRLSHSDKRVMDIVPFVERLATDNIDFSLKVIGNGQDEDVLRSSLEAFVRSGRVVFIGWKTREELYRDIYPKMDCVASFSPAEGVTIAPREAMIHGVVPVISQFRGLKAEGLFLNEVNSLTFPVGDIDKAVQNIKRLVTEPGLIEKLSANAMNSQAGKYTFEGSMDAWVEALNRCMEQPPALGPLPKIAFPADGRLTRMGLSPWVAQRVRDLFGRNQIHNDPGSEWPQCSGLMTKEFEDSAMNFAKEYEASLDN